MRKVTASAVILTAITGCSQSEVPSAEWSFDTPESKSLNGEFVGQWDESSEALNDALATDASGLFTQSSKDFMGPAGAPTPLPSDDLSVPLASGVTPGNVEDWPIQGVTPRTDPLAPVRAYLASTHSISDVTNRVPYSSQVYLPEAPIYTPSSVASTDMAALPVFEALAPAPSSQSVAVIDAASVVADFAATDSTQLNSSLVASTEPVPLAPQSFISAAATPSSDIYTSAENTYGGHSARYIEESYVEGSDYESSGVQSSPALAFQDTLPVLEPAPVEVAPAAPAAVSISDEPVSIGTAILQDLAQDGNAEASAVLAAASTSIDAETDAGTLEISIEAEGETEGASEIEGLTSEDSPTLEGLLASVPSREGPSPLLSFEVVQSDSQDTFRFFDEPPRPNVGVAARRSQARDNSIPAFRPLPVDLPVPAGLLPIAPVEPPVELAPDVDTFPVEVAPTPSVDTSSADSILEGDISSNDVSSHDALTARAVIDDGRLSARSALLESLEAANQSDVALSTVYVPIPESSVTDVSAEYIREAIAALPRGANGVQPTAELPAELADRFASQLVSAQQGSIDVFDSVVRLSAPARISARRVLAEEQSVEDLSGAALPTQKGVRSRKVSSFTVNHRRPVYRQRIVWQ